MTKNQKTLTRIIVSAVLYAVALVLKLTDVINNWWQLGIFAAIFLLIGYDVIIEAVVKICHGQLFDEEFLMTVATIGAFAIGEYADAVAVMLLYQIGELFQRYAVGKSRKSIAELMDIRPESATVVRDGQEIEVHPSEIELGEIFIVKAGEKIALDGVIVDGSCHLDTSTITGESVPRAAKIDENVISGCINLDGVIYVRAASKYDDSTVSKILDLVENATEQKAPAENFITKFSRIYTPVVVALAVLIGVIPPLIPALNTGWTTSLRHAMMFLFVSCPCALVISVPMGFFGGIAAASKQGILVKGSNYLEVLAKADTFAFDKTGTLTKGNFVVTSVYPQAEQENVLKIAAIAEQYSNHPIALSICSKVTADTTASVTEIAGMGIQAECDKGVILCGNEKLMQARGIDYKKSNGGTVVYVALNGKFVGDIEIADELKEDAKEAIDGLKTAHCTTVMLTGDNNQTAQKIAAEVGVDQVFSQLLPQDKVEKVDALKEKGTVAFVGDGINDAPVLATADVGIAMGGMGSDAAIEAADVVLMRDNPTAIVQTKKIAKKTLAIVKENIVFSLLVKFAVLILSAIGVLDKIAGGMIIAILADVGVCFIAIVNSMRAMYAGQSKGKKEQKAN